MARFRGLFQFKLRTILVVVLCSSTLLGYWRWQCDRINSEQRIAQQVEQLGLGILWQPMRPKWFWACIPAPRNIAYRHAVVAGVELKSVWAHSDEVQVVGDELMEVVARLPHLRRLTLPCLGDHGGPMMTVRITDSGLKSLTSLKRLTYLDLTDQPISDAGLEHLSGIRRLKRVELDGTRVTPDGVARLRESRPGISIGL